MVSLDEYVQDLRYAIDDVMIDVSSNEVHLYVSEYNEAQKSIPKVIDGNSIIIIKLRS